MATSKIAAATFGKKTVTSAGTAEAVATGQMVNEVLLIALSTNTGRLFYGGSDVDSSTQEGLAAGASITITSRKPFDIALLFIDVDTSGEGVDFVLQNAV